MNHSKSSATAKSKVTKSPNPQVLPVLSGMKDAQGHALKLDVPKEVLQKLRAMG